MTLNGTALSGVSFNAGSGTSCSVSDAAGQYSCTVPWSYTDTITPSKAGYLFTPGWTSYTHVQANQGAQDYRAQAVTPSGVAGTVYYIQGDHLDTPRSMTDQSGNEVWRWDNTEPFGDSAPNDDPNNTCSHVNLPVGLSLYYGDKETGQRYAQRRDCYDPVTGRFCQSDPIGLLGGINTYGYASSDPVRIIDPLGLETIVIVNGKTSGNPFGHTAIATTGSGLYSPGNNPNASNNNYEGASVTSYLEEQAQRRDTTVFILPTLPQQERAINDYMKAQTSTPNAFPDNCASRVGDALQAGGVTLCDPFIPRLCLPTTPVPETLRRGLQQLESDGVARSVSIPRNGSVPSFLQSFNPK